MSDTTPAAGQAPVFQLQRVYLKDASLEMPNAPRIFLEAEAPAVDIQLEVTDGPVIENVHEVVVRVTATAKVKDKVLFLVEGKQGGIFEMRNIPAEQMGPILGVVCPGIIYPVSAFEHRRPDHPHRFAAGPSGGDQLRGVLQPEDGRDGAADRDRRRQRRGRQRLSR
jgi:protein-export chaperone SecB